MFLPDWKRYGKAAGLLRNTSIIKNSDVVFCFWEPSCRGTNVCILKQTFGIQNMVSWGMNMMLLRDLTDSFYSPKHAPYVSHEEGTQLSIGYIEKFWCPSMLSKDIVED